MLSLPRARAVSPSRASLTCHPRSRMQRLQEMKSSGHGRYEEIVDEKDVIRVTACVHSPVLRGVLTHEIGPETRSVVSSTSSIPTSSGVRSWISTSLCVSCYTRLSSA